MGHMGQKFKVGDRVRVIAKEYCGYTGTIRKVYGSGVTLYMLDRLPPQGFTDEPHLDFASIELVDDAPVPVTRESVKTQPSGSALADFFKGPTNYASCPKCRTGKLVPMFSGEALCDQACERNGMSPSKITDAPGEYWATGDIAYVTLWSREEDARYWAKAMGNGCNLFRVRLLPRVEPPRFKLSSSLLSKYPAIKAGYSSTTYSTTREVKILEEVTP